jgi:hypothetical protein
MLLRALTSPDHCACVCARASIGHCGVEATESSTNKQHIMKRVLRYTCGLGWRMHCGVEVTESSTNKQHTLSPKATTPPTHYASSY